MSTIDDSIAAAIQTLVDKDELAGASALIWRNDGVAFRKCWGRRDVQTGQSMEPDTIFRIASMSKPIITVAALILIEEGRIALDQPVHTVAPQLAAMRVLRDPGGPLSETEPANRAITFEDLLTHRAGLSYADLLHGPVAAAYRDSLGPQIDNDLSPDEWIARLAKLPLISHPGASFQYGHATDLLGFLIARVDGAPLGEVLHRRVFSPLGMVDTGFAVPDAQSARRAGLIGFDASGQPAPLSSTPGNHALAERPGGMTYQSGGQGLWSTIDDYLLFARMLIGGGELNGTRLLSSEMHSLMTTNQLSPEQRSEARILGQPVFAAGHGYGMGVAVVMEPEFANPMQCGGGVGAFGWPGAYGGWWQADPNDGSVLLFLTHNMVGLEQMSAGVGLGVWTAISEFQRLATMAVA